jgi:nucleoside-diphosphate-sugar epimerase
MKRVLVTGGCGFIGHHLVMKLLKEGYEVTVFDNQQRGNIGLLESVKDKINYYNGDIRQLDDLVNASVNIDVIIHLAFVNGTKNFYSIPSSIIDIGIRGLMNVYDAAKINNIKELFLASSSETYQTPPITPTPEDVPLIIPDVTNPRYSYGGTKILYELVGQHYRSDEFDRVITFRPHNVYGTNMGKDHVIPELIEKIKKGYDSGEITLLGDGTQTRSFCHIDDFCDGILTLLISGKHKEIYHIGNDEEVTIEELCKKIFNTMNVNLKIKYSEAPRGETNRRIPDISKLKSLGYNPKINLDEGLVQILNEEK